MKQLLFLFISLSLITTSNAQNSSTNVMAKETPKLIFKIGNGMSRMPAAAVRSLTKASVEMIDFSTSDYKLQNFTIRVLYDDSQTFKKSINLGSNFTEETKEILNLIKPSDIIVVSGISAINSKGEIISIPERSFGVY